MQEFVDAIPSVVLVLGIIAIIVAAIYFIGNIIE